MIFATACESVNHLKTSFLSWVKPQVHLDLTRANHAMNFPDTSFLPQPTPESWQYSRQEGWESGEGCSAPSEAQPCLGTR